MEDFMEFLEKRIQALPDSGNLTRKSEAKDERPKKQKAAVHTLQVSSFEQTRAKFKCTHVLVTDIASIFVLHLKPCLETVTSRTQDSATTVLATDIVPRIAGAQQGARTVVLTVRVITLYCTETTHPLHLRTLLLKLLPVLTMQW